MYIFCVRWMKTSSKIGLVLVAFEIILVRKVVGYNSIEAINMHLMICKWFKQIKNVFSSVFCCLPELEAVESGARAQIWDGTKLVGLLPPWCLLQVGLHQVQTGAFCVYWHLIFCRMGEYMDSNCKMRDFDLKTWQSEGKPAPLKVKFSILWKRGTFLFLLIFPGPPGQH